MLQIRWRNGEGSDQKINWILLELNQGPALVQNCIVCTQRRLIPFFKSFTYQNFNGLRPLQLELNVDLLLVFDPTDSSLPCLLLSHWQTYVFAWFLTGPYTSLIPLVSLLPFCHSFHLQKGRERKKQKQNMKCQWLITVITMLSLGEIPSCFEVQFSVWKVMGMSFIEEGGLDLTWIAH